jgi:hypothetical protein
MPQLSRRQALTGIGVLATGVASPPAARRQTSQDAITISLSSDQIAALHTSTMDETVKTLGAVPYVSREGASAVLKMISADVFNPTERKWLERLLDIIFSQDSDVQQKAEEISILLEEASEAIRGVARAIVLMAQDSLAWARERLTDPSAVRLAAVVGADVVGALGGVQLAAKVSPHPLMLALGAAAGALPASVKAWDEFRER